ncbi:MAG: glycosyl transferase family 28 [Actinomycetota bacterium]|nr:glycosyl transferase family 28 [Actinomycetota bacterium]
MSRVFVAVGTDVHPFDRLVGLMDEWGSAHPEALCFVQYGTSTAPSRCDGADFLPHEELSERIRDADIVVTHGGPATITEVWAAGRVPLCMPRDPAFGEHVDGHQQRFARSLAGHGRLILAEDSESLGSALDSALADPSSLLLDGSSRSPVGTSVGRAGELIGELLAQSADPGEVPSGAVQRVRHRWRRHRPRRLRRR